MSLKNVRVEYSVETTINIGNFENVKPGIRVSADVEDGTDPRVALDKLRATLDPWLEKVAVEIKTEAFSG